MCGSIELVSFVFLLFTPSSTHRGSWEEQNRVGGNKNGSTDGKWCGGDGCAGVNSNECDGGSGGGGYEGDGCEDLELLHQWISCRRMVLRWVLQC